ncbi:MAG: DMT family transporter [Clostridia bacterium]|nr:DMT family transporter [Clostridia bacterium]
MNKQIKSSILLLITAIIWGVAFVAQDVGMEHWSPFAFNGIRNYIGAAVLLPFIYLRDKSRGENAQKWSNKTLLIGGVLCGIALCSATCFQQFGIQLSDASAGKAGFITAFYIVLVPITGIFIKKKCPITAYIAAIIAAVGLYILCIPAGEVFKVEFADVLVFICALIFTIQILLVDYYSPKVDGVKLACIQFFTSAVISTIGALVTNSFAVTFNLQAWIPILYAGVLSSGVAYTLQIIGQKNLNPTVASIIMSLEACVSVIAAWIILGDAMNARQITGCVVMFAAILLAQLPMPEKKERKQ